MPTPTTAEGYQKIRNEIEELERDKIPQVRQAVADARSEGDLKENAEYHGQRENLAMLEAKVAQLKGKLADLYIVDMSQVPKGEVAFGSRIKLLDLNEDFEEEYEIVGPGEEDYSGEVMKILCTSPLAKQLLSHKAGDKVEVETPGGKVTFEILEVA